MSISHRNVASVDIQNIHDILNVSYGPSRSIQITQEKINQFAELTEDDQWIHTDPVRASKSEFGTTIAHGFFILSLVATINMELVEISGTRSRVNYGLNKVRFPASVPTNTIVRGFTKLKEINPVRVGTQLVFELEIRADDIEKPVCIAEFISLVPGAYLNTEKA